MIRNFQSAAFVRHCAHMEVFLLFVVIYIDQAGSKTCLTLQYTALMSVHTGKVIKGLARVSDPSG